ncbi:MAG: SUMF1/EgtB/PvdO family nonheme iron enzyme, partial [Anaerolineae bacterium]
AHRFGLRRFFTAFQTNLLQDKLWGPILERVQEFRYRTDMQQALESRGLAAASLVQRLNATVTGPGAAAQGDHPVAAGALGVAVGGDVGRIVQVFIQQVNLTNPAAGADAQGQRGPAKPDLRARYLERLRRQCAALPLAALGGDEGAEADLTLDHVYIALDTTARVPLTADEKQKRAGAGASRLGREDDTRPLSALEAAGQASRLVLLGDPGAGKSTFVRKLAAWLAAANRGEPPPPDIPGNLLPVIVVLRDLAARLAGIEVAKLSGERRDETLAAAVRAQAVADLARLDCAGFAADLRAAIQDGTCLLILDGLDEVPFAQQTQVRQAVGAVIQCYHPARLIVTCRIRSYTGAAVLPNVPSFTLAPFDDEKVRAFATAWYNAQREMGRVDAEQARRKAANLAEAALSADLRELAENPMMLTTMAIIHQREIGLPKERVRLYSLAVDVLLRRWQQRKAGETGLAPSAALSAFLRDDLKLRLVMERLAYEAHRAKRGAAVDLERGATLVLLDQAEYLGDTSLAAEFLDYVDQRAGLLLGRGGELGHPATYSFPHRTFQEYLAGCYLVGQREPDRTYYAHAAEGDYFGLAARLGAEELLYNRRNLHGLLDLAYHLCPAHEIATTQARRATLWAGLTAALAGRETIERDANGPDGGPVYLARLIPRLAALLAAGLTPPERADAGVALARLGDPRGEAMTIEGMAFCFVPAGRFVMGSAAGDKAADSDEKPQHAVDLAYGYWMGRYPVTNAQYAAFVAGGGYDVRDYWPEAAAADFWRQGEFKGRWDDTWRRGPNDYGEPFTLPNHPVVGVSWYEALAFVRWLSGRAARSLPAGWEARLPSEAEWEKAARGGEEIPVSAVIRPLGADLAAAPGIMRQANRESQRTYPWGEEITPEKANYDDTGIGATSAVGCFPLGASPYGVEELSGNVWEWTRSLWGDYPYPAAGPARVGRENLK